MDRAARAVIGAAIEVHRILGPGFVESIYEEALCIELELRGLPFARQASVGVSCKGKPLRRAQLDLVVADLVVVELKAVEDLLPVHAVQLHSYLRATSLRVGLLINFNVPILKRGIQRLIWSP